jgi:uncharacterized protein
MTEDRALEAVVDLEGLRADLDDADVRYAVVFGSVASGTASPTSDLDLCLRFAETCSRRERFRQRNRLDAAIRSKADRFVDVSDLEALPDTVALNALRDGVLVYGDAATKAAGERDLARRVAESSDRHERRRHEFIGRLAEGDV